MLLAAPSTFCKRAVDTAARQALTAPLLTQAGEGLDAVFTVTLDHYKAHQPLSCLKQHHADTLLQPALINLKLHRLHMLLIVAGTLRRHQ
jgi:hypothetical protein